MRGSVLLKAPATPENYPLSLHDALPISTAKKVAARKTTTQPRPVAKSSAPVAFQPKTSSGLKYNDLVTAVLYRDAEAVSQLIKLGRWADKPDSRGTTPLMLAVEQGDARTAQVLLKAGAEPSRAVR